MDYIFTLLNTGVSITSIYLLYRIYQTQSLISAVLENCQKKRSDEPHTKEIKLNISKIECNSMEVDQASITSMQNVVNDINDMSAPRTPVITPRSEDVQPPFKLTDSVSRKSISRNFFNRSNTNKSLQLSEIQPDPVVESSRSKTKSKYKTSSFIDMIKK